RIGRDQVRLAAVQNFDPTLDRFGSRPVIRRCRLNVRFARKRTSAGRFMSTRPSSFLQPTTVYMKGGRTPLFKPPKLESESYESGVPRPASPYQPDSSSSGGPSNSGSMSESNSFVRISSSWNPASPTPNQGRLD